MNRMEQALAFCDRSPCDVVFRGAIGFVASGLIARYGGESVSVWAATAYLLLVLAALRVATKALRLILPASADLRSIWDERRRLGKYYDSYQWRKLLWVGVGMAAYIIGAHHTARSQVVVSALCVAGGAAGLVRWRAVSSRLRQTSRARGA
jgi:hypothetical protein